MCDFSANYTWRLSNASGAVDASALGSASQLLLPRGLLSQGGPYIVSVQACDLSQSSFCSPASAAFSFAVKASALVAVISGGLTTVTYGSLAAPLMTAPGGPAPAPAPAPPPHSACDSSLGFQLDASLSSDPDRAPGLLLYQWSCSRRSAGGQPGNCTKSSGQLLSLQPSYCPFLDLWSLDPGNYSFTLVLSKDMRRATASTSVVVLDSSVQVPMIFIPAIPAPFLNPWQRLDLAASVAALGDETVEWSFAPGSATATALGDEGLFDPCTLSPATPISACSVSSISPTAGTSFLLLPQALKASTQEAAYRLRLTVSDSGASQSNSFDIRLPPLGAVPSGGVLTLLGDASGLAASTPFLLQASGWQPANATLDLPLSYAFLYQLGGGPKVYLTPFEASSGANFSATVYLPPGDVTLLVRVASARGVYAEATLQTGQAVSVQLPSSAQLAAAVGLSIAYSVAGQPATALHLSAVVAQLIGSGLVYESQSVATCVRASVTGNAVQLVVLPFLNSAWGQRLLATTAADAPSSSMFSLVSHAMASLTATASQLGSLSTRNLAFAACSALASAPFAAVAPLEAVQDVLYCLSNISASVVSLNGSTSLMLYAAWGNVSTLAATLRSALSAPGEQPIVLTSPMFDLQLSLDYADNATIPAGAAASRLFDTGVRAVPAGFGTLSPSQQSSVCNTCEGVRTTFKFAAFDPYLEFPASSGIARLELNYLNGSVVAVNNLDPPVSISLPAFSGSGHATCAFFNTTVGLYSADGVIGLPNPLPATSPSSGTPALNVSFGGNWTALRDEYSHLSTGALLVSMIKFSQIRTSTHRVLAGCTQYVLDCPTLGPAGVVYLNPDNPMAAPAVRCPELGADHYGALYSTGAPPALLVFTGASCALWQPGNSMGCYWNAAAQAFVSSGRAGTLGCVSAPAAAQPTCLSTHLTDFVMANSTSFVTALEQLAELPTLPAMRKARVFLGIFLSLAGLGWLAVRSAVRADRARSLLLFRSLMSPACGFLGREMPKFGETALWTWRLHQSTGRGGSVGGPIAQLAQLAGIPLARLLFAIPEELLPLDPPEPGAGEPGPLGGLSAAGVQEEAASMVSTALVFGLLHARQLVARDKLIRKQADAGAHFEAVRRRFDGMRLATSTPRGQPPPPPRILALEWDFDVLVDLFRDMLSASSALAQPAWLDGARLWRLVLLCRRGSPRFPDGFGWDASPGLASALRAFPVPVDAASGREGAPVAWQVPFRAEPSRFTRDQLAEAAQARLMAAHAQQFGDSASRPMDEFESRFAAGEAEVEPEWFSEEPHETASPLDFSADALLDSIPAFLYDALAGGGVALAMRVWTTLLVMAQLEEMDDCWASAGVESLAERTLLDDAEAWLGRVLAGAGGGQPDDPAEAMLRGEALLLEGGRPSPFEAVLLARTASRECVQRWRLAHEVRCARLRTRFALLRSMMPDRAPPLAEGGMLRWHAVLGDAARALRTRHAALSCLLAPAGDAYGRAARAAAAFSSALLCLVVVLAVDYGAAADCCRQTRARLGCSADTAAPCRGFSGDCADLSAQFSDFFLPVPGAPFVPALEGFSCAPPALQAGSGAGQAAAGALAAAAALALRHLLLVAPLVASHAADRSGKLLRIGAFWRLLANVWQPVVDTNSLGQPEVGSIWRYGSPQECPSASVRFALRNSLAPLRGAAHAAADAAASLVARLFPLAALGPVPLEVRARKLSPSARDALEETLRRCGRAAAARGEAAAAVAAFWAASAWYLFAYGPAYFSLVGLGAEWGLVRAWLVALALDAAVQAAAVGAAVAASAWRLAADELWLMSQHAWFERHLDTGSVLASLSGRGGEEETRPSAAAYAAAHARHLACVAQ